MKGLSLRSELPTGWASIPLRALADYWVSNVDKIPSDKETPVRLCNYSDVYKNEFVSLNLDFMRGTATDEEIRRFRLHVGDVLITKDSESWEDIAVPALVCESADDFVCGYHLALLRPKAERVLGRFLFRCLQARPVRVQLEIAASDGVTRFGVPKSEIGSALVPVPSLQLQQAIADYLDRETARIDALLAEKERLFGLLAEKRQAIITRAVTRGLDPNAPLRDSNIPWLGPIPAHWKVTRVKLVAEVRGGLTLGKTYSSSELAEYPYLRVANVQDGRLDLADVSTVCLPESEAQLYLLQRGDVLMNEGGDADKVGRGCTWSGEISPCLHQNHVFAVRPTRVTSEWLDLWTSSDVAKAYFESRARQSTNLASISARHIKELPLALAPQEEQRAIVSSVRSTLGLLDGTMKAVSRSITLLRERRSALIAAAVTGQIPIPEPDPIP